MTIENKDDDEDDCAPDFGKKQNYLATLKDSFYDLKVTSKDSNHDDRQRRKDLKLEKMPLAEARVAIFTELSSLIETELHKYSSIEWESRIQYLTVMENKLGIDKRLSNASADSQKSRSSNSSENQQQVSQP